MFTPFQLVTSRRDRGKKKKRQRRVKERKKQGRKEGKTNGKKSQASDSENVNADKKYITFFSFFSE